jgi:hypothetical protein
LAAFRRLRRGLPEQSQALAKPMHVRFSRLLNLILKFSMNFVARPGSAWTFCYQAFKGEQDYALHRPNLRNFLDENHANFSNPRIVHFFCPSCWCGFVL